MMIFRWGSRFRDYMKRWGRDDPYHNMLDLGPASSKRIVAAGVGERRSRRRLGMRWPFQLVALVIAAAAAAAFVTPHWSSLRAALHRVDRPLTSRSAVSSAATPFGAHNLMHLMWRPGLQARARTSTQWWVNTPTGQRVEVTVRPGDAAVVLARALAPRAGTPSTPERSRRRSDPRRLDQRPATISPDPCRAASRRSETRSRRCRRPATSARVAHEMALMARAGMRSKICPASQAVPPLP